MNNTIEKNICKKHPHLYSFLIWICSMIVTGSVLVSYLGADKSLLPILSLCAKIWPCKPVTLLHSKLQSSALMKRALNDSSVLGNPESVLLSRCRDVRNLKQVTVVIAHDEQIRQALESCSRARAAVEAKRQGKPCDINAVATAVNAMNAVNDSIKEALKMSQKGSSEERRIQNSETLAKILYKVGNCFEFQTDAVGFSRSESGNGKDLIVNGYWRFVPKKSPVNIDKYLRAFGFSTEVSPSSDLSFCILQSGQNGFQFYHWSKEYIDLPRLLSLCGLNSGNTSRGGISFEAAFSEIWKGEAFRPLFYFWTFQGRDTVVVDLRAQQWSSWSISSSVSTSKEAELKNSQNLSLHGPFFQKEIPAGNKNETHRMIEEYIHKKMAPDAVRNEAAAPNVPVSAILASVEQLQKKGAGEDDLLSDGTAWEKRKNYSKAYQCYAQAAAGGSEKGALNCALLLLAGKFRYIDRSGNNISGQVARDYALKVARNTNNQTLRGYAYNILGGVYKQGLSGVPQDLNVAVEYFKKGVQCGNEYSRKNLRAMGVSLRAVPQKNASASSGNSEQALRYIEMGLKLQKQNKFQEAFQTYLKGANLGNVHCSLCAAMLLVFEKAHSWDNRRLDVSFRHAQVLAEYVVTKSTDKKYRGVAFNFLGIIFSKGGFGVQKNFARARMYYKKSIEHGNESAVKNLKKLEKMIQ